MLNDTTSPPEERIIWGDRVAMCTHINGTLAVGADATATRAAIDDFACEVTAAGFVVGDIVYDNDVNVLHINKILSVLYIISTIKIICYLENLKKQQHAHATFDILFTVLHIILNK